MLGGAIRRHKQLPQGHAIENRRAIARSANTGISAFINAKGRIEQTLAYEEQGALGKSKFHDKLTFTASMVTISRAGRSLFLFLLLIALSVV